MNMDIYDLLDKLDYTQLIQVGRTLLCIINESETIIHEISQDIMDVVKVCYDIYESNGDIDGVLDYIHVRISDEIGNTSITDEDIDELLNEI